MDASDDNAPRIVDQMDTGALIIIVDGTEARSRTALFCMRGYGAVQLIGHSIGSGVIRLHPPRRPCDSVLRRPLPQPSSLGLSKSPHT